MANQKSKTFCVHKLELTVMEIRQLEYFVYVADEHNFTRAAARAHVAQPGVSAQIRRLERELGEPLFDRSRRTVCLTDAGEALLPFARAALDAVSDGRLAVEEIRGLVRGRVRTGMMAALPSVDIAALLADFRDRYPAIQLTLVEASSSSLLDRLLAGDLDSAIVGLPHKPPPGISSHPIHLEQLVLATSHDDPLAARASVALDALRSRPFISLPHGSGLRAFLQEACRNAGFEPEISIEASDPQLLVQLTARGLGVSLLPRSLADAHADLVHSLPTRPRLNGRIALAWKTNGPHSPASRQFIRHARETLS
jgi:DNA-binding transcriptional LysR family regulator